VGEVDQILAAILEPSESPIAATAEPERAEPTRPPERIRRAWSGLGGGGRSEGREDGVPG
jgi:hypothetical protein